MEIKYNRSTLKMKNRPSQQSSSKDPIIIFLSFELMVPHGQPGNSSTREATLSIPTSIFYACHKDFLKMDSGIIRFSIKANERRGLGFNGPISGLHHPEYIWIASHSELCSIQPCCDGLEVKKCGCSALFESIEFRECMQEGQKEASCLQRTSRKRNCVYFQCYIKERGQTRSSRLTLLLTYGSNMTSVPF